MPRLPCRPSLMLCIRTTVTASCNIGVIASRMVYRTQLICEPSDLTTVFAGLMRAAKATTVRAGNPFAWWGWSSTLPTGSELNNTSLERTSGYALRLKLARSEVGIGTLRAEKLTGLATRMLNSECHGRRPPDRVRNFGITYMRTTANVCGLQWQQLERNTSNSTKSFVLCGATGQFTGCDHEAVTTTPQMVNQSDCSEYRATSHSVSKPNKHCVRVNNGSVLRLKR